MQQELNKLKDDNRKKEKAIHEQEREIIKRTDSYSEEIYKLHRDISRKDQQIIELNQQQNKMFYELQLNRDRISELTTQHKQLENSKTVYNVPTKNAFSALSNQKSTEGNDSSKSTVKPHQENKSSDSLHQECKQPIRCTVFRGHTYALSNLYKFRFRPDGEDFERATKSFTCVEQAYVYAKAVRNRRRDLQGKIINAASPYDCVKFGYEINGDARWQKEKTQLMRSLLTQKLKQCPEYRSALANAKGVIAEGTGHPFWASGLSPERTRATAPSHWPGANNLGKLHMELQQTVQLQNEVQEPTTTILIGDSNVKDIQEIRLKSDQTMASTIISARDVVEKTHNYKTFVFHVGVNDAEILTQKGVSPKETENIMIDGMSELIQTALNSGDAKVIISKILPHQKQSINKIVNNFNIKLHNLFIDNENICFVDNSAVSYHGMPNKRLFRDDKHLNYLGTKILASNILSELKQL